MCGGFGIRSFHGEIHFWHGWKLEAVDDRSLNPNGCRHQEGICAGCVNGESHDKKETTVQVRRTFRREGFQQQWAAQATAAVGAQ